jgi:hypothetical protein
MATNCMTDAEFRRSLHWAQSAIAESCPAGFWEWLERNHPIYHTEMTSEFYDKVQATWGTDDFGAAIDEFFLALSVAVPMFEFHGKENKR